MINYNHIALIIIISIVVSLIVWHIWLYNSYKFQRGDSIIAPYYKKTYYLNKKFVSNYDFNPFFNKIKKNIENDPTIDHYLWILYYDSNDKYFYKAELMACYKIGVKTCKLRFQSKNVFFTDKTQTTHLCIYLIDARCNENILAGELYKENNKNWEENNDMFIAVFNENTNEFLGYNINQGSIKYKIVIDEDDN